MILALVTAVALLSFLSGWCFGRAAVRIDVDRLARALREGFDGG